MIRQSEKSCKKGVCSIQCFPHTTRCCACFSDYGHTSRIQGYLYSGVCTFGALQPTENFSKNLKGYLFSEGYLFTGFYGNFFMSLINFRCKSDYWLRGMKMCLSPPRKAFLRVGGVHSEGDDSEMEVVLGLR